MFVVCFVLAALLGWAVGAVVGWGKRTADRAALRHKYRGIRAHNVRIVDNYEGGLGWLWRWLASWSGGSDDDDTPTGGGGGGTTKQRSSEKRELLRAACRVLQYVFYKIHRSEIDNRGSSYIDQVEFCPNKGTTNSQKAETAELLRRDFGDLPAALTASSSLSNLSSSSSAGGDEEAIKRHLFPGRSGSLHEYKRDERDASQARVVARNHGKGGCYEVCLDKDPADASKGLNDLEHVVSVLLHEVAHTIHCETKEPHNSQFHAIYQFLVATTAKVLDAVPTADAPPLVTGSLTFDRSKFKHACDESSGSVTFCGTNVDLAHCNDDHCKKKPS